MFVCFRFDLSDSVQCPLSTHEIFCLLKYRFLIIFPLSAESRSPSSYSSSLCARSCPAALQSHFCVSYGPQEPIPDTPVSFKSSFPSNSRLVSLAWRWKQFHGATANISHNLGDFFDPVVLKGVKESDNRQKKSPPIESRGSEQTPLRSILSQRGA